MWTSTDRRVWPLFVASAVPYLLILALLWLTFIKIFQEKAAFLMDHNDEQLKTPSWTQVMENPAGILSLTLPSKPVISGIGTKQKGNMYIHPWDKISLTSALYPLAFHSNQWNSRYLTLHKPSDVSSCTTSSSLSLESPANPYQVRLHISYTYSTGKGHIRFPAWTKTLEPRTTSGFNISGP